MEDAIGNWVWLADFAGTRATLCLGDGSDTIAEAMSRHFESTWVAEARARELARLRTQLAALAPAVRLVNAEPDALPFGAAAFDCVTLHGLFDWWPAAGTPAARAAARVAFLADCRRVLRPAGRLYVAHENRRPALLAAVRKATMPAAAWAVPSSGEIGRALRSAGFRRIRSYYADPAHMNARYVIPRTRASTLAYERALFQDRRRAPIRRGLAAVGLHRILYGSVLYLADP